MSELEKTPSVVKKHAVVPICSMPFGWKQFFL